MSSYFVKRLLLMIPTLLGISLISFLIIHLTPGDPALMKLGDADQLDGTCLTGWFIDTWFVMSYVYILYERALKYCSINIYII